MSSLRRSHFHPRRRGRKPKKDSRTPAHDPPIEFLKVHWMREVEEELICEQSVDSYSISSVNGEEEPECLAVAEDFATGTQSLWASPTSSVPDRIDGASTPLLSRPETVTSLELDENLQLSSEHFSVAAGFGSLPPGLIAVGNSYIYPFETSTMEPDTNMPHADDWYSLNINPTFQAFSALPEMSSSVPQLPPISSMLRYGDFSAYQVRSTPETTNAGAFRRSSLQRYSPQ